MKRIVILIVISALSRWVEAERQSLACADPALTDEDFRAAVGPQAAGFKIIPDDGHRCRYEHAKGSTIRIETRASGTYTADDYNSKKEADASKADAFHPKPIEIPSLGAAAYKLGDRVAITVNLLDRPRKNYIEIEVKINGMALHADTVAEKLAHAIDANSTGSANVVHPAEDQDAAACHAKLSSQDVQKILGLSPDQYEFKSGAGGNCSYHAKSPGGIHRFLRFSAQSLASRQEAALVLNSLRKGSLERDIKSFGKEAGILSSGQLWFVTTNRKWVVTVSYHEVGVNDADQETLSGTGQLSIRDEVARAIDRNVGGAGSDKDGENSETDPGKPGETPRTAGPGSIRYRFLDRK